MTTVFLVRHAKSTGGPGDAGLSEDGSELARRAAARFVAPGPMRVFSSPLRRARETAECFADRFSGAVTVDPGLRERENWGDVPGESWDEFVSRWERCNVDRDFVPVGGPSSRQAGEAVAAFVRAVTHADDSPVLAVSHGGVIVDFLLNVFSVEELQARKPDYREMAHCAVTEIKVHDGEYTLVRFADETLVGG